MRMEIQATAAPPHSPKVIVPVLVLTVFVIGYAISAIALASSVERSTP